MKIHAILAAAVSLIAVELGAAFQYDLVATGERTPLFGPYGLAYSLKVTEGSGSIYVTDVANDVKQFSTMVDTSKVNWGTFDLGTGKMTAPEYEVITLSDGRSAYKLGDFSVGDNVGIWMTSDDGDNAYSSGYHFNSPFPFIYRTVESKAIGNFGFRGLDYAGYNEDGASNGTIRYELYSNSGAPSGQPLPGVLATLLIGGGIFGASRFRKLKKS